MTCYPYTLVLENSRRRDPICRRTLFFALVLGQLSRELRLLAMDELSMDYRSLDYIVCVCVQVMEVSLALYDGKHLLLQCEPDRCVRLLAFHPPDTSPETSIDTRTRVRVTSEDAH